MNSQIAVAPVPQNLMQDIAPAVPRPTAPAPARLAPSASAFHAGTPTPVAQGRPAAPSAAAKSPVSHPAARSAGVKQGAPWLAISLAILMAAGLALVAVWLYRQQPSIGL